MMFFKQRQNKYDNQIQLVPCAYGYSHRSKLELAVCQIIHFRELAGEIKHLQHEDHVLLSGWYTYIPDFRVLDLKTNEEFWIEAKGDQDKRWPSTRKGWKHAGPGRLEVWKGRWQNPMLFETIIPKE